MFESFDTLQKRLLYGAILQGWGNDLLDLRPFLASESFLDEVEISGPRPTPQVVGKMMTWTGIAWKMDCKRARP